MKHVISFIKHRPQIAFWGIAYFTFFVGYLMYALFPSELWNFAIWGTCLGGILVTAIVDGREGLKSYFSRIVRWRVGVKWYAVALFLPLVIRLAALGLTLASGATLAADIQWPDWSDFVMELLIVFFLIALGEEPGFRGFALPRMLVGRSALTAALIVGVLHTLWHLPMFITGEVSLMNIFIILSGSVLITWLFNHTQGSVFMIMVLHFSVNMWVGVFNPLFTGADAAMHATWLAMVYVATALILVAVTGPNLTRQPAQQELIAEPAVII